MDGADRSLVGKTIAGKFDVLSYVGGGAMGEVYKARQLALDKVVALKVMHAQHAKDAAFSARFQREAKAASRLDHPNSMRVLDFGEDEGGLLYIAMEFLDGRDLLRVMEEDWPLSNARIVDVLSQVLAALSVAHDMGVVHRDLKPENIMLLSRIDDEGRPNDVVKVCDFGIAKINDGVEQEARRDRRAPGPKYTTRGIVVGTPEYMSPEQGKGEPLDARSDLYSVGVVLYQLLTGHLPFDAETPVGIVLKHVTQEPIPPRELRASVDPRLEAVCLTAMKKRPDDRYPNARAMRAALRAALEAVSLPQLPVSAPVLASAETEDALPLADVRAAVGGSGRVAVSPPHTSSDGAVPAALSTPAIEVARPSRRVWPSALLVAAALGGVAVGVVALSSRSSASREAAPVTLMRESEAERLAPPPPSASHPIVVASNDTPVSPPPLPHERVDTPLHAPTDTPPHLPRHLPEHHVARSLATTALTADTVAHDVVATAVPATTEPGPLVVPIPGSATPSAAPPPPPVFDATRGMVSLGGVQVTGATERAVRSGLGGRVGAFTACYRNALAARQAKIEGSATLHLTADDSGRVIAAQVRGLPIPEAARCIEQAAVGFSIAGADTGEPSADVGLVFRMAP